MTSPFFKLHRNLPREGPGEAADVLWALETAGTPATASICDAACGPGADTVTLALARPQATMHAVDRQTHFVEATEIATKNDAKRVKVWQGDYRELPGKYDLIWCAGAVYFTGVAEILALWRDNLNPGGAVAFSEPAWLKEPPSAAARAFWGQEAELDNITNLATLNQKIASAGWRVLGQRWIVGQGWLNYYEPMECRIAELSAQKPTSELVAVLDEGRQEIKHWRAAPDEIAYSLQVVTPT